MPDAGPAGLPTFVRDLLAHAEDCAYDLDLAAVRRWKAEAPGRKAVGYLPVYVPQELCDAAGVLPVAVFGGGDRVEIIRGDAFYQSYICHIPRSTIELAVGHRLDALDGMIFPATCDVIRNLSGMWQVLFPDRWAHYFDFPQASDARLATDFCREEYAAIREGLARLTGRPVTDAALRTSIARYNTNRQLVRALYERRRQAPWQVPASESYVCVRAGAVLPVEAHNRLLATYLEGVRDCERPRLDNSRVVLRGAFCEQPPLGLIRTLERAGCDLVDDDFLIGMRYLEAPVAEDGDPLDALAAAYVRHGADLASRYRPDEARGTRLVAQARRAGAEGVVFCAASFCDPALLDQPMLQAACDAAGLPTTAFKFSEDSGQFQVIREQAGTFADSIRLWSAA